MNAATGQAERDTGDVRGDTGKHHPPRAKNVIFLFMAVFDAIGTLIAIGEQGGFLRDGRLPRATPALMADSSGTVIGSLLGTSTVTAYVESATGVEAGARTGLANVVTGMLFFLALFFAPLARNLLQHQVEPLAHRDSSGSAAASASSRLSFGPASPGSNPRQAETRC